ncbi:putative DNA-binding domain-containing protein [Labrys sp. LIt4]|uniref:HvfC/BufC family peptide modification chaperone n=1 Tax=Labrys sp. LIt4 TaxID=2821355 RepID=UPI001ADFF9C2|nr:putative DNA-binding domain-containing protein [Labrys sp. LIt4]MBP0579179.1 putative DNA-binding domain-containing protein [Labrys sp. LIt4]
MRDLAAIQAAFQNAIAAGDDGILAEILDGAHETRSALVDIYREAYLLRLYEAVRRRNGILAAYLGDNAFETLAHAYIDAVPSRHTSLCQFCRDLPAFLERNAPYADRPVIADLARIAEALADAFDAPDHTALAVSAPAIAMADAQADFVVIPHPSVRRLSLLSNAATIWSELEGARPAPAEMRYSEPQGVIVWRRHATVHFRSLAPAEATLWDAACAGKLSATPSPKSGTPGSGPVATYLGAWAAEGLLSDLVAR